VKTWRVTITNLTPVVSGNPAAGSSQPLSPPLAVVHTNNTDVWSVGGFASPDVAAIAEDADNASLTGALAGAAGVRSVETVASAPIFSGASYSFEVTSRGSENRLTLLSMLVNTNDAFTGLDSLHLSGRGGTYYTQAYDAGSEANDQLAAHIPGPCCGNPFVRNPTSEPIAHHAGIVDGVGDLSSALWGWSGPAAKIVVERVG
jgi:Spondin_N